LARLTAGEPAFRVAQPVTVLGELAFVDDIEPDLALPLNRVRYEGGELDVVIRRIGIEDDKIRQAADVRCEDFLVAPAHAQLSPTSFYCPRPEEFGPAGTKRLEGRPQARPLILAILRDACALTRPCSSG
jgi:hypothetical protein